MTYCMASLTKKLIHGRSYYYLRECQRVNGKPKIVWQLYLGSAEDLARRLTSPPLIDSAPQKAIVREFGASAACLAIAQQLDLVATIDRHVPKQGAQGPSVGQYLLVALLNRCIAPRSKARIWTWFDSTVLPRLLHLRPAPLTSQRFWDNMDRVDEVAIAAIERDVSATAVAQFGLDLRCLLFDATNFFTFVDSFNLRAALPQRGHSKEGRANLRLLGLALLVTADGDVPLFHHVYAGNQHDAKTFGSITDALARRYRELGQSADDITLVFDKGNNSKENLAAIDQGPFHFVGSLVPTQHPELLAIDRKQMRRLDKIQLPAVWSRRTHKNVFRVKRTVLVTFNRRLFKAQHKTLRREITKRRRKLHMLQLALKRHVNQPLRGRQPTVAGTRSRVRAILTGRHMKDLFTATVEAGAHQLPTLQWSFNQDAWDRLERTLLGKTVLFTDRDEWTDEQIVRAYRSQSHVEAAFRQMKDPHVLTFRPIHHWTDQKLRVHALYSVLALVVLSLLRRKLSQAGITLSIAHMIERLAGIREVAVLFPAEGETKPYVRTVLSDLDAEQLALFKTLDLARFHTP
jgi:transposase